MIEGKYLLKSASKLMNYLLNIVRVIVIYILDFSLQRGKFQKIQLLGTRKMSDSFPGHQ